MIITFKARGGIGIANTMSAIKTGRVTTHPIDSAIRTLRKIIPNVGVSADDSNNSLGNGGRFGVHNAKAVNGNSSMSPLILVSKVRKSVGTVGPRSVRGVSILGSTTTSSVCNSHTPKNIVLVAAGGNGSKGPSVGCGGGFQFGSPLGVPRVTSSCDFTLTVGSRLAGKKRSPVCDRGGLRRVLSCRRNGSARCV